MLKWFTLFTIGLVLLGLAAVTGILCVGWWVERTYQVHIDAPPGVSWTLWVPAPEVGTPSTLEGVAQVHGRVESIHGTLLNVTGSGEASLRYADATFAFERDPFRYRGLSLSGLEVNLTGPSPGYWTWRAASEASANVSVNGGTFWRGYRVTDTASCGGAGFRGPTAEGWTLLPIGLGDCVQLVSVPPPEVYAAALLLTGTIAAVVSLRRRSRNLPT